MSRRRESRVSAVGVRSDERMMAASMEAAPVLRLTGAQLFNARVTVRAHARSESERLMFLAMLDLDA